MIDQYLRIGGADAAFGIAIALWLLWGAWHAAGDSVAHLMDAEWPTAKREAFLLACADYSELNGMHDVRTRSSGVHDFIQFHVWLPPEMSVAAAHDIVDAIETRVAAAFPGAEILIHVDPAGHYDPGHQPETLCA